jgi:hypothetical protein
MFFAGFFFFRFGVLLDDEDAADGCARSAALCLCLPSFATIQSRSLCLSVE